MRLLWETGLIGCCTGSLALSLSLSPPLSSLSLSLLSLYIYIYRDIDIDMVLKDYWPGRLGFRAIELDLSRSIKP